MFISEEDIKDPVDFEDLKGELSDALWNLTDDLDDETLQKINDLKEDIQEKHLKKTWMLIPVEYSA